MCGSQSFPCRPGVRPEDPAARLTDDGFVKAGSRTRGAGAAASKLSAMMRAPGAQGILSVLLYRTGQHKVQRPWGPVLARRALA
jgi:hypothetical protein